MLSKFWERGARKLDGGYATHVLAAKSSHILLLGLSGILVFALLGGCNSDRQPKTTRAEYLEALRQHTELRLDATSREASEVMDNIGKVMCRAIKRHDSLVSYLEENPVGTVGSVDVGGSDYGTLFICPEFRDEYVDAGGFVLDLD